MLLLLLPFLLPLPLLIRCTGLKGGLGTNGTLRVFLSYSTLLRLFTRDQVRAVRTGRGSSVTNQLARVDRQSDVVEHAIMCNSVCYFDPPVTSGFDDSA